MMDAPTMEVTLRYDFVLFYDVVPACFSGVLYLVSLNVFAVKISKWSFMSEYHQS